MVRKKVVTAAVEKPSFLSEKSDDDFTLLPEAV
jgi:hypothetical protein